MKFIESYKIGDAIFYIGDKICERIIKDDHGNHRISYIISKHLELCIKCNIEIWKK